MSKAQILVLDFGSQYTQLIARRLRECGVYTEIIPYFEKLDSIKEKNPKGIILSGGPASVYEEDAYKPDSGIFDIGVPILGICYGMQYVAYVFGGSVVRADTQEFGRAKLEILDSIANTDMLYSDFVPCKDKEKLFLQWKDSFCEAHSFMIKKLLDEICKEMKSRILNATHLRAKYNSSNDVGAFGFYKARDDNACEFECYVIHRDINHKDVLCEFLANLSSFTSFYTQWDKFDKKGLSNFTSLGFSQYDKLGKMALLKLDSLRLVLEYKNSLANTESSVNILHNIPTNSIVWMSHADKVESLPSGFIELARSGNTHYCAIAHMTKKIYALQFHPEVAHTEHGRDILENFARICNCEFSWSMRSFASKEIDNLRSSIGNHRVLCAVSGGVDSSVVATLLYKAIGDNVIPIFVDTGLLRKGEKESVEHMFKEQLGVPLIIIDASNEFLESLHGISDPEKKRKIIGETFIKVFEREAKAYNVNGEIRFLAQGTLYPDVIESVSIKGPSKVIKSHHNVGGLPEWMKFSLIEPLRELFKDEVRLLGRELGIPESMLMRHPFPGPGLTIRIIGEVTKESLDLLREADSIFIQELHKSGLYNSVWQAFCVLLNVKSVGVMGDNRTYDNTICLRAVNAIDGMTASFSPLSHDFLECVSNRIINEICGINRVVYDITSKPPGTIEWE